MTPSLPDFAAIVRARLAHGGPLLTRPDPAVIGREVLRQLKSGDTAPGGSAPLRMSALGKCDRSLAFRWHSAPEDGRVIDGRARATFAMGDMAEALLVTVLGEALAGGAAPGWGLGKVRTRAGQAATRLRVRVGRGLVTIPGHPDGLLLTGRRRAAVLEAKSASSYAFSEWDAALRAGRAPWTAAESYWWQIQGYLYALHQPRAYELAVCKDSGAITGWWMEADPAFLPALRTRLAAIVGSAHPRDVPRRLPDGAELGPVERRGKRDGRPLKGHGELPWQCRYCSHYRPCWGADRLVEDVTTDYRGRPSLTLRLRDDDDILPGIPPEQEDTAALAAVGG